jgi:hypothetical protein
MVSFARRDLLKSMLASGVLGTVGGCWRPLIGFPPEFSDPNTPLTIDSHTHVFNGSDLQIGGFLRYVVLPQYPALQGLAPILQELAWHSAPSGAHELGASQELRRTAEPGATETLQQAYDRDSQRAYRNGVEALKAAKQRASLQLQTRGLRLVASVDATIDELPYYYRDYKAQTLSIRVPQNVSLESALAFILRNFQYRYVNVFDYLNIYSTGKARKVDLFVAHLVDYDWPIGSGHPTATTLRDQIGVMNEIAAITGGRVHYFVPFDPMKEVANELGLEPVSALQTVKDAFAPGHAAIGVKLYPPMGFAPYGNAAFETGTWNLPWLPGGLRRPDLGQRLDAALLKLYRFCIENDVPIMAHTNCSLAPCVAEYCNDDARRRYYDKFLNPLAWGLIPAGLRVDFGHFGDTQEVADGVLRPWMFSNLMTAPAGSHGEFFYADSGYFAESLNEPAQLAVVLQSLYDATKEKTSAALAQRLMYGTDWEMVVLEGKQSDNYLSRFEEIIATIEKAGQFGAQGRLSDRFFGANAATFLGLRAGSTKGNRGRMAAFYAARALPTPGWMVKVDKISM